MGARPSAARQVNNRDSAFEHLRRVAIAAHQCAGADNASVACLHDHADRQERRFVAINRDCRGLGFKIGDVDLLTADAEACDLQLGFNPAAGRLVSRAAGVFRAKADLTLQVGSDLARVSRGG
jgi:hypothetical protein